MVSNKTIFFFCISILLFSCKKEVNDKTAPVISVNSEWDAFKSFPEGVSPIQAEYRISDNEEVQGLKHATAYILTPSILSESLPFIKVSSIKQASTVLNFSFDSTIPLQSALLQATIEAFDPSGNNTIYKTVPFLLTNTSSPTINIADPNHINDGFFEFTGSYPDSLNFTGEIVDTDTLLKASVYSYNDSLKTISSLNTFNLDTTYASADSLFTFKWETLPAFSGFVIIVEDKLGNINAQYYPIK